MSTPDRLPLSLPSLPGVRTRVPVGTILTLTVWTAGTLSYRLGAVGWFHAVRRDPDALAAGQWWRVLSPVLVQPDPWLVTLGVGILCAVVGVLAERTFGTLRWAALWLAGASAGHLIGELWQPLGSGISVAFCGPLGALAIHALGCRYRRERLAPPFLVLPVAVLLGAVALTAAHDIHGPAILAGALVGLVMVRTGRDAGGADQIL